VVSASSVLSSSWRAVLELAWAVTACDKGEIGRIDGNIGIGAPPAGRTPLVHVALLFTEGLTLFVDDAFRSEADGFCIDLALASYWGTAGALSRAIRDRRNQEGFDVVDGVSCESLADLKLRSECFRPSSREADDFGRRGSIASAKNSWSNACLEVGLFFGSHMRHQVIKLLKAIGHCGGCRMVSIE
jgi:hypothetical protein